MGTVYKTGFAKGVSTAPEAMFRNFQTVSKFFALTERNGCQITGKYIRKSSHILDR